MTTTSTTSTNHERSFDQWAAETHDHLGRVHRALARLERSYDTWETPPALAEDLAQLRRDALRIVRDVEKMAKVMGIGRADVDRAAKGLDR